MSREKKIRASKNRVQDFFFNVIFLLVLFLRKLVT